MADRNWIGTKEMADLIGCSRATLVRMQSSGYFTEGPHYQRQNPTSVRSKWIWNRTKVLIRLNRI